MGEATMGVRRVGSCCAPGVGCALAAGRGGGREGRRMQRERGWNQSRVESRVVVVQGGGEGRRGGRGRGGIDVIGRIGVGMGRD